MMLPPTKRVDFPATPCTTRRSDAPLIGTTVSSTDERLNRKGL